jgi:di/tricarboxylate transporter
MTFSQTYVAAVIIIALALIITERLRADLVALVVLLALGAGGVVSTQEALSGFSRSAVITILGLFVITAALDRTGFTRIMADHLLRIGGGSETRMVFLFTTGAAVLSLFMNNIAAGAVLLPAAINVSRRTQIPASKLLMPLSFGTLLGGMATYFTTANILVSTTLRDLGQAPLRVFDFTPTGGIIAVIGIIYMIAIGRRLLPLRTPVEQYAPPRQAKQDLETVYALQERLWEAEVLPNSPLAGKSLTECGIGERLGLTIVGIWHKSHANLIPAPEDTIAEGDLLLIAGREDRVTQLVPQGLKIGRGSDGRGTLHGFGAGDGAGRVSLVEVVVAPHSQVEGRTLKELNFRKKYGLTAVALWRDGRSYRTDVGNFPLRFGDALLMVGAPDRIKVLSTEPDYIVLGGEVETTQPGRHALVAVAITIFVLAVAALNLVPVAEAMLMGMVLMVLTGCVTMDEGYRAVEWRAIFLIAGMLPISIAMSNTGLAARLGSALIQILGPYGPLAVIGGLYVLTVLLTQVMSGQVTALVLAPIAVSAALQIGTSPQAAALAVAIGCSTSFLTPLAHPVNVLMMGPGGYTFGDFFKVGWGLTVVCFVALMIALPLFWRL